MLKIVGGKVEVSEKKENKGKRSEREADFVYTVTVQNGSLQDDKDKKYTFTTRTIQTTANNENEALEQIRKGWGIVLNHII